MRQVLPQLLAAFCAIIVVAVTSRAADLDKQWPDRKMIEELEKKRPNVNYREENVPPYTLPDPLLCRDGTRVTTREQWEAKDRPETLELFRTYVYGRSPAPGQVGF